MEKEAGTVTIRDSKTGRIHLFKPEALEGAELKIGDTVDAVLDLKKVSSVKGAPRSYELLDPIYGDSCCVVLKLDSLQEEKQLQVTARNNTTGEKIYFNIPKEMASALSEGSIVFTKPTHGYAMITTSQSDTTQRLLFGFPLLAQKPKD